MNFGSPMDDVLKFQVKHDKSFMYIFNYRPELDPKPFWMGEFDFTYFKTVHSFKKLTSKANFPLL